MFILIKGIALYMYRVTGDFISFRYVVVVEVSRDLRVLLPWQETVPFLFLLSPLLIKVVGLYMYRGSDDYVTRGFLGW